MTSSHLSSIRTRVKAVSVAPSGSVPWTCEVERTNSDIGANAQGAKSLHGGMKCHDLLPVRGRPTECRSFCSVAESYYRGRRQTR